MGDFLASTWALTLGSLGRLAEAAEDLPVEPEGSLLAGIALLVGGLCMLKLGLPLVEATLLPKHPPAEAKRVHWGGAEVGFVAGAILVALQIVFQLLSLSPSPLNSLVAMDVSLIMGSLVGLLLGGMATRRIVPELTRAAARLHAARAMGFTLPGGTLRLAGFSAASLALAVPAIFGVMALTPHLLQLYGLEHAPQAVLEELLAMEGAGLVAGLALATLMGPFLEEVLFRGFVQPLAVQGLGPLKGILITSAFFGLIHGIVAFLPIFALSLVLGYLRHRSASLLPAIIGHCLWNGGTMLFALTA